MHLPPLFQLELAVMVIEEMEFVLTGSVARLLGGVVVIAHGAKVH